MTGTSPSPDPPRRLVCLSQETAETLVLLGLESRVVGVSRFVARPHGAFRAAARVGGFSTTDVAAITELEPDLVLCYSEVQAELTRELVAAGLEVHVFNHRDLAGMLAMVGTLARLMGVPERGADRIQELSQLLASARLVSEQLPESERPRVYFEEWNDPLVCGIHWVSELIELAGGRDVFHERARLPSAEQRVVQPDEVLTAAPEVMLASWCGRPLDEARVRARPGWDELPALRAGRLFHVEGAAILSPGPGLLTEGLALLRGLLARP